MLSFLLKMSTNDQKQPVLAIDLDGLKAYSRVGTGDWVDSD